MLKEFKEFISRGNVVDLAVGVIIGSAFGKIVSSIVDDILMPLIGVIIGGINFKGLSLKVGDAVISYGNFLQNVIDFLIVAACIFLMVKFINRFILPKKKEEPKKEVTKEDPSVELLKEIRDLLKENKKKSS
ncbi:MAG: large-conductance mechanosensitive channel protein MscL [Firmicutes bacterium]|nr:large-conductance mechanosensitive channel protein MscL [Bacillota bacterium]